MVRDFGEHAWSLRFLERKLSYFNIHNNDHSVWFEDVISVVNKKLMGPGRLLGCPCNAFKNQKHSWTEYATRPCVYRN